MFTTELNNYAYGWFVNKSDSIYRISHGGSVPGFRALIDRYPEKELLIVILSNDDINTRSNLSTFSELVLDELNKTGYNKR